MDRDVIEQMVGRIGVVGVLDVLSDVCSEMAEQAVDGETARDCRRVLNVLLMCEGRLRRLVTA
jgi:hypothetical protein